MRLIFIYLRKIRKTLSKKWSLKFNKRLISKRFVLFLFLIISLSFFYILFYSRLNYDNKFIFHQLNNCDTIQNNYVFKNTDFLNEFFDKSMNKKLINVETDRCKILLIVDNFNSKSVYIFTNFFQNSKFKFNLEVYDQDFDLINKNKGKYCLIVFENYDNYLNLNEKKLFQINNYCLNHNVGIIGFLTNKTNLNSSQILTEKYFLKIKSNSQIKNYHLNKNSKIFRILKPNSVYKDISKKDWIVFEFNSTNYSSISRAFNFHNNSLVNTVIYDLSKIDGIKRVLFGNDLNFWLHKLLFLDSISFLTNNKLQLPLERFLQIDIDDIFVGEKGTRFHKDDIQALISGQEVFKSLVDNFKFRLGFSGKFFHKGNEEENLGDDLLVKNAKKFDWFCHMWAHSQPHLYTNVTFLENQMQLNKNFAQKFAIPIDFNYSVAPHHSGVFPVHEPLYEAWKKVYNVKVTSTEEYPHLRPARFRKGFIHRGIKVLPRQTCGLYTHTIYFDKYPGGKIKLDQSIYGGELFFTFIFNPVNIFMTHMSNYANDRLGLYTFQSVLNFLKCWTNLNFKTIKPIELSDKYFELNPNEKNVIWNNPCFDKRHLAIWSQNNNCNKFPKFIVVGPQKTGTTALHMFLSSHPSVKSNFPSKNNFEEIQFFNSLNYFKGINWYLDNFPEPSNNQTFLFEKSANYFDGDNVPLKIKNLLPKTKIIVILINPINRAYSWYQHAKFHNDVVAKNYSFYEVITSKNTSIKGLKSLRNRSLQPGCFASYLKSWLQYFDQNQLIILDGDELKYNPADVMQKLQISLNLKPRIDYNTKLYFDNKKGFYCLILNETTNFSTLKTYSTEKNFFKLKSNDSSYNTDSQFTKSFLIENQLLNSKFKNNKIFSKPNIKCLGKSKGRNYSKIDSRSINYLHKYYMRCNTMLFKMLVKLKVKVPAWLLDQLT